MSILSGIDIFFENKIDVLKVINFLIKNGWSPEDHGKIAYLPLGDDEKFDWQYADLSQWNSVVGILGEKIKKSEPIGISLVWKETLAGGEFLFDGDGASLGIALSINRKNIDWSQETDFAWYIDRIVHPLAEAGFGIKKYETCDNF